MIYAPVRIGTLNRYTHFKRCLESLERNSWAKYTEVYVSIDYPTKESHWEGYEKIKDFLAEKEQENGFLKLYVYRQEKNLGTSRNYKFLEQIIYQKYDRLISLEDDIETAPNFLEYMDKALEWGADDNRIYCACAYFQLKKQGAVSQAIEGKEMFLRMVFNPWGTGYYKEKRKEMQNLVSKEWLDAVAKDSKKMFRLFRYRKYTFYMFVMEYLINKSPVFFNQGGIRYIDIVVDIYLFFNEKYAMFPTVSKTRNWGFDGSGANCGEKKDIDMTKFQLDDRKEFEITEENYTIIDKKVMKKMSWGGLSDKKELYIAVLYYFCYRIKILFKR